MGATACSLVASGQAREDMILSGRIFTAQELHGMGVVDILAEDGFGEVAARLCARNERRRNGAQAVSAAGNALQPRFLRRLMKHHQDLGEAALRLMKGSQADEPTGARAGETRAKASLAASRSRSSPPLRSGEYSAPWGAQRLAKGNNCRGGFHSL